MIKSNTLHKLWDILTLHERRDAIVLFSLMLIGMIVEMLGIGIIIPALAILTQHNVATSYPMFAVVLQEFGNPTHQQLVVAGMLVLVGVYVVKAIFIALLTWRQMHFGYATQAEISLRLFTAYLRMPYTFHLQRNSAKLIQNATAEVGLFAHSGLISSLILLSEFFVLIGISVLLIYIEPVGALVIISTLGFAGWGFYYFTRHYSLRWGGERQRHEGLRLQYLQQGLGGVKDVKLLGREAEFLAKYQHHNAGSARIAERQFTLMQLPRLWLELLAVIALAAMVLTLINQGRALETIVPTIGVFAAAAFRLMPSINRILASIQSIRFALPVIDTLHAELAMLQKATVIGQSTQCVFHGELVLDNVNYQYPVSESRSLRDVSLSIPCGAFVGFVGQSGAGKSTLVDILLGLLTPSSGSVMVDGADIQQNLRGWQDQIGYVPQTIFLTDDSLRRNVAFGLPDVLIDEAAVLRSIQAAQLDRFVSELPEGLNTIVGERGVRLSGGQRQRIGIARALYHDPAVLVLDEATSSLDTSTESGVMAAVRALKGTKTIIVVAHRLSTVECCDWLYLLERGQVVSEGRPSATLGLMAEADSKRTIETTEIGQNQLSPGFA